MRKSICNSGLILLALFLFLVPSSFRKGGTGPWKEEQLIQPEELVQKINKDQAEALLILNTGPVEDIKGAVNIGAAEDAANIRKLKDILVAVPKNKEVIIYCGCCPLSGCPNIKPAYKVLKEMKFERFRILNLVQDLQEDWIDKGYPMK
jgi:hypothetical protein